MRFELLVDGAEFLAALERDLPAARRYAFAQALTFEGDGAGRALACLLSGSAAADRRLIIDHFSNHVVSDRWVWHPLNLFDRSLREERRAGRRVVADLRARGVGVRYVNPVGPLLLRFPARNHKKVVVMDDVVAYLGGINFSDHNFAWHDLMIRIEDPEVAAFLRDDVMATWAGRNQACSVCFEGLVLHVFDGRSNETRFARVFETLSRARRSIFVQCPYLTDPFRSALAAAARRGVEVTVVVPERNNWRTLGRCLAGEAARGEMDVRFFPDRMTHMKAMLVDDDVLLVGSANFDVISYRFQQEYLAEVTDPGLLADFRARVVEPDLARARRLVAPPSGHSLRWARWKLGAIQALSALAKDLVPAAPAPRP